MSTQGNVPVVSPAHQQLYDNFLGRVELAKVDSKKKMSLLMDELVDDVYGNVLKEVRVFVGQVSEQAARDGMCECRGGGNAGASNDSLNGAHSMGNGDSLGNAHSMGNARSSGTYALAKALHNASMHVDLEAILFGRGLSAPNAKEPSVANAANRDTTNSSGGEDNAIADARENALADAQQNGNSRENARTDARENARNYAQQNGGNVNENGSQLSALDAIGAGEPITVSSQASGSGGGGGGASEIVRIINQHNQLASNTSQPEGSGTMRSSEEVAQRRRFFLERLKSVGMESAELDNAQEDAVNDSVNDARENAVAPSTNAPIAKNRTEVWRFLRAERQKMDQQLANVSIQQQQQQLANAQQKVNDSVQNNARKNNARQNDARQNNPALNDAHQPINPSSLNPPRKRHLLRSALKNSPLEPAVKKQKVTPNLPKGVRGSRNSGLTRASPSMYSTAGTSASGPRASQVVYSKVKGPLNKAKIVVKAIGCDRCGVLLPSRPEVHRHLVQVHKVKPMRCPLKDCGARFDIMQQLGAHVAQKHKGNYSWRCSECPLSSGQDAVFERCHELNLHIRFAHEVGAFGCPVGGCDFEGATGHLVAVHYDAVHREVEVPEQSVPGGYGGPVVSGGDVPLVRGDFPLVPEVPMSRQQRAEPVIGQQARQVVIKTEPTDDENGHHRHNLIIPDDLDIESHCPWPGCKYKSRDFMAMARHVQVIHLNICFRWIKKEEPEESSVRRVNLDEIPMNLMVVPKSSMVGPKKPMVGQKNSIVGPNNSMVGPKKPVVIKEEMDESNSHRIVQITW